VTAPNQRTALASLDAVRPVLARLDPSRHPEENAADLIEVWNGLETALRALLGGSTLAGQALVRELRQHEMISLEQGHALLEALAVHDRVQRTEYQPTETDISEMRAGFQALDQVVSAPIPAPELVRAAQIGQTAAGGPAAAAAPAARPAAAPSLASVAAAASAMPESPVAQPRSGISSALIVLGVILLVLIAGGYYYYANRSGVPREIQQAEAAYAAGQRDQARAAFEKAVKDYPNLAAPHIYLSRLARDQGDLAVAGSEIATAVKLEPQNAIANRELGEFFLARGSRFVSQGRPDLATADFEGARRAYVRAVQLDTTDLSAQGYLGCALVKLGRARDATAFFARAGQGAWSACANQTPATGAPAAGAPPPKK
jgi:tetratricopeptide (TPR) repeat protein